MMYMYYIYEMNSDVKMLCCMRCENVALCFCSNFMIVSWLFYATDSASIIIHYMTLRIHTLICMTCDLRIELSLFWLQMLSDVGIHIEFIKLHIFRICVALLLPWCCAKCGVFIRERNDTKTITCTASVEWVFISLSLVLQCVRVCVCVWLFESI